MHHKSMHVYKTTAFVNSVEIIVNMFVLYVCIYPHGSEHVHFRQRIWTCDVFVNIARMRHDLVFKTTTLTQTMGMRQRDVYVFVYMSSHWFVYL